MRIGLRLAWLNGRGFANFIGDHTVALGWQKALVRADHSCQIVGPEEPFISPRDAVIHFHPGLKRNKDIRTLLYNQNSWPREKYTGGTVGVFHQFMDDYDGHIFVSQTLKNACFDGVDDSPIIPFATDPEFFYPRPKEERYAHPIAFVGNDIRGDAANDKHLIPAIPRGLVVYGGPFRDPRIQAVHRGRIPQEDLPKVYSSTKVNLNFTAPIAVEYGIVASRIYDILACGGVLEDHDGLAPKDFRVEEHTWDARMKTLVEYLK